MSFLDPKEEVVDLILTRRGRALFAIGKLNPTYYGFYDDEIVYDSDYAFSTSSMPEYDNQIVTASTERQQHSVVSRIKSSIFSKNQTGYEEAQGALNIPKEKRIKRPFKILGRSSVLDQEKPAWEVSILDRRGYISGSHPPRDSGLIRFVPLELSASPPTDITDAKMLQQSASMGVIPQIDVFCDYDVTVYDIKDYLPQGYRNLWDSIKPEDRKKILWDQEHASLMAGLPAVPLAKDVGAEVLLTLKRSSDDIYLDIKEHNVDNTGDNFILEVFQYEYGLSKKYTDPEDGNQKQADTITDITPKYFSDTEHNKDIVGYYFDLSFDQDSATDETIKFVDDISLLDAASDGKVQPECGPGAGPAKPLPGAKLSAGASGKPLITGGSVEKPPSAGGGY